MDGDAGVQVFRDERWWNAVFERDIERRLMPREGIPMTIPRNGRAAREKSRAAVQVTHVLEIAKPNAQVRELEGRNTA